jgi:SAM-dependent methyltransferase
VVPKSSGLRIETADYIDQQRLREKYAGAPGVDTNKIEPVDYVLHSRSLAETIPYRHHYDYIVASHVIEHMPDLLGFLLDCQLLMKPAGVLALAVPDKRACFDFLSPVSTTGQILEAHSRSDRRPRGASAFDHHANSVSMQGAIAWALGMRGPLVLEGSLKAAYAVFSVVLATDRYSDVHVWRFVPSSARLILSDLRQLDLIALNRRPFSPRQTSSSSSSYLRPRQQLYPIVLRLLSRRWKNRQS